MSILSATDYKKRRQITTASTPRDEAITAALASAEQAVLNYTGRDFTTAEAAETREYAYNGEAILETDDFTDLTSLTINEYPLTEESYILGPREGDTYYWIDLSPWGEWPTFSEAQMGFTRNLDTYFTRTGKTARAYTKAKVTATFGWPEESPADVKQAVAFLVDEFMKNTGTVGEVQAESIADLTYVYQRSAEGQAILPPRVQQLLDPYRRLAL